MFTFEFEGFFALALFGDPDTSTSTSRRISMSLSVGFSLGVEDPDRRAMDDEADLDRRLDLAVGGSGCVKEEDIFCQQLVSNHFLTVLLKG